MTIGLLSFAFLGVAYQDPGPSLTLFNNPYYSLTGTNFYVSTSGSDSNTGTGNTASTAWATLNHANSKVSSANTVINVLPGTYTTGVNITNGGNAANSTGYVVYRSTTLGGAIITDPGNQGEDAAISISSNYVIIDGFTLQATTQQLDSSGIVCTLGGNPTYNPSNHHLWFLNNTISGYGLAGIAVQQGDFLYAIHNTCYNNARNANCNNDGAQGSGISFVVPYPVSGYSLTSDDQNNPVTGNTGSSFRLFIMWNECYNNSVSGCSPHSTDGNGIIADTWSWNNGRGGNGTGTASSSVYIGGGLIAFNVCYNNGGAGISVQNTYGAVCANNSVYNNYLDTGFPSTSGDTTGFYGNIIDNNSWGNLFINNLSIIPGNTSPAGQCAYLAEGVAIGGAAVTSSLGSGVTSTATSLVLSSTANMPNGSSGWYMPSNYSSILAPAGNVIQIESELMQVSAGWGTSTLTLTNRGLWNTTAASHANAVTVTWVADAFINNIAYALPGASASCSNCFAVQTYNGMVFSTSVNSIVNPDWVNVANTSVGTITSQPSGVNFSLSSTSPATASGSTYTWLPAQSIDMGACYHALTTCP